MIWAGTVSITLSRASRLPNHFTSKRQSTFLSTRNAFEQFSADHVVCAVPKAEHLQDFFSPGYLVFPTDNAGQLDDSRKSQRLADRQGGQMVVVI